MNSVVYLIDKLYVLENNLLVMPELRCEVGAEGGYQLNVTTYRNL